MRTHRIKEKEWDKCAKTAFPNAGNRFKDKYRALAKEKRSGSGETFALKWGDGSKCKPGKCDGQIEDLLQGNPGLIAKLKAGTDSVSCQALTSFPRDCLKGKLGLGKLGKKWDDCHAHSPPSSSKPNHKPGECPDIDGNSKVNIEDLLILLGKYDTKQTCKSGTKNCADIDGNGMVNVEDLLNLLAHWGIPTKCNSPQQ